MRWSCSLKIFNAMAYEITQLISNRTLLFGGISHDLKPLITRMIIALELIENSKNSNLVSGMRNDLNEMKTIIDQTLNLIKGLDRHHPIEIQTEQILNELMNSYQRHLQN